MKTNRIVTSITIYPFGRNASENVMKIERSADKMLAEFGTFGLVGRICNTCGMFYQLKPEHPLLLISSDGKPCSVLNPNLRVVLTGMLENGKCMSVNGVEYSLDTREPNFLEKMGLEVLENLRLF